MEGRNGSGSNSGGVVKNRSSSGCLVIKKKPDGISGPGSSGGRKVYESKKAKKRARVSAGEAVSSEEEDQLLEYYRSRAGPGGGYTELRDMGFGGGRNGLLMKRSKLDVYDFDEYDDLSDAEMMGARHFYGGGGMGSGGGESASDRRWRMEMGSDRKSGGGGMDFEGGGSSKGDVVYKRRNSFHGVMSSERVMGGGGYYSGNRRFRMENEMGISTGKDKFGGSEDAIRLQGKNGVLKVRVKPKAEISPFEQRLQSRRMGDGSNVLRRGPEFSARNIVIERHSPYAENNLQKKPAGIGRVDKSQKNKRKLVPAQTSGDSEEDSEDDASPEKIQSDSVEVRRSSKRGRKAGNLQSPELSQPIKGKEGKVKRGSGTEKQLLREKIRSMLVNAGWTIDYRPRKGRDYSDAVYVNPSGTAYWSIIKAYDALQKQLEEDERLKAGDDSASFAPISEDTLSKLTRQTRKKIEKELKRKKREEGGAKRKKNSANRNFEEDDLDTDSGGSGNGRQDDRLSAYVKRNGRPPKGSSKDFGRDGNGSNSKMQEKGEFSSSMPTSRFIHARKSNKIGRCTLLVRNSEKGHDSENDGFVPYTGRRNLLSWLIDAGTVNLSEKVLYMNRKRSKVMLEGWITKDGIHCGCCSKILSVSKFEIHAASKLRQPFQNIYLSNGASLLECLVATWNKQEESLRSGFNKIDVNGDDPNEDTCAMCGDGGNLICCDGCPSTFHQNCLDIKMLPPGDWHCPHCSCKFCGLASVGAAEVDDTKEDILLTCSLCEGKYHCSCVEVDGTPVNSDGGLPFCGIMCHELYERLQKLLGVKYELEGGLCWSLIHRTDLGSDNSARSFPQRVEWNSKLAVALTIMDECFLPINDRRSGINMIHNALYNCGSNFTRLNYSGFYTALLERGDEIVSAASIRIHGTQFAEMPFIGTRHIYRRQGMCRRLFSAIEMALRSLKVEKLVIPAISELMDTWTRVFGFSTLEESDKRKMKTMNMLVFPGTDMVQKKLLDGYKMGLADAGLLEADDNASHEPDFSTNSDIDSSPGPSIPDPSVDNEKVDDKSVADLTSQRTVVSVEGTTLDTCVPQDVCDEVKQAIHIPSTEISVEIASVVSVDSGQGITTSPPKLDMNLQESNEKDHISPNVSADIQVTTNVVENPVQSQEVSTDSKLMQKASEAETVIMGDGGPGNDKDQSDGSLSVASEKCQSLSESSHDIAVAEKSVVDVVNREALEADHHVSHGPDSSNTSDCGSSPKSCVPNVSQENGEIDGNIADVNSLHTIVSVQGASPHNVPQDVSDKPPSNGLVNNSSEIARLVSGNGSHETTTSPMQLDVNLKESVEDEKFQISPDLSADIDLMHNITADCNLMQEASKADTNMIDDCGPGNDKCQNAGSLSAASEMGQSLSETTHDVVAIGNSVLAVDSKDPLEADLHESDLLDSTKASDRSSSPKACIPNASLNGGEVDDKSITDISPQDSVTSVEGNFLEKAHQDDLDNVKPPTNGVMNNSGEVGVLVSGDGGQGTTTSPLELGMDLKEPVEGEMYHVSSDLSADTRVTANVLKYPGASHKGSANCELMQEVSEVNADIMGLCGPGNDECRNESPLLAVGEKCLSLSGTSLDVVVAEKSVVAVNNKDSLEADHHVPDVPAFIDTSGIDSQCGTCIPDALLNEAKMDDVSSAGTSLDVSSQDDEVKLHSLNPIDVTNEAIQLLPGDGGQGTMTVSLQLDMSSKEPVDDEKDHISSDVCADINVTANVLDDLAEEPRVSVDSKFIPGCSMADTDITCMGVPGNDKGLICDGLSSESGIAAGEKYQPLPETSNDDVVIGKSLAAVNDRDSVEDEVDDAHVVPGNVVDPYKEKEPISISEPSVSGSDLICLQASGQSAMPDADQTCCSLDHHGTVVADESQLSSCDGVRNQVDLEAEMVLADCRSSGVGDRQSPSQSTSDVAAQNDVQSAGKSLIDLSTSDAGVCSELQSLNVPDLDGSGQVALPGGEVTCSSPENVSHDACSTQNLSHDTNVEEKLLRNSCGGVSGQSISEGGMKHAENIATGDAVDSTVDSVTQAVTPAVSDISANEFKSSPDSRVENPPSSTN